MDLNCLMDTLHSIKKDIETQIECECVIEQAAGHESTTPHQQTMDVIDNSHQDMYSNYMQENDEDDWDADCEGYDSDCDL